MKAPEGKTRLDMIKEGLNPFNRLPKRGRLVVSISKIVEDPANERRTFRNMDGLIESVKRNGIIEPPTAEELEGGVYRISTGHRRLRAAKAAGLTELEIIVRDPEDPLTLRRKSIVSNVQREDIGVVELAEALRFLMEQDDSIETQRDLADVIGKTPQWVSDIMQVLRLPANLQEKIRTSVLSVSYDSAMKIARCQDPVLQEELVEAALRGETVRQIRRRIADSKPGAEGKERPSAGKSGGQAGAPLLSFYETCEGYTASVHGPEGKDARRHMRNALERLLDQLRHS